MKVNVEVSMDDIEKMLKEINEGGGKDKYSPLEIALAKKSKRLFESLKSKNDEKNRIFGVVYQNYLAIDKAFGDAIRSKRSKELMNASKKMFANAVRMNSEATGNVMMNPPYTTPEEILKVAEGGTNAD